MKTSTDLVHSVFGRGRTPVVASSNLRRRFDEVDRQTNRGPVLISYKRRIQLVLVRPEDYVALQAGAPMTRARRRRHLALLRDLRYWKVRHDE